MMGTETNTAHNNNNNNNNNDKRRRKLSFFSQNTHTKQPQYCFLRVCMQYNTHTLPGRQRAVELDVRIQNR